MNMREGKAYIDGEMVLDLIKMQIVATPEVAESRSIGQRGKSRQWVGMDYTGSITEYRSTPWLKERLKKYQATGQTPNLTIVGVHDDKYSSYNIRAGNDVITVQNAVITSDIVLVDLDSEGELVQTEIEFGAENVIAG